MKRPGIWAMYGHLALQNRVRCGAKTRGLGRMDMGVLPSGAPQNLYSSCGIRRIQNVGGPWDRPPIDRRCCFLVFIGTGYHQSSAMVLVEEVP